MLRLLLPLSALLAIASAFLLYSIKHDTRALEFRLQTDERAIERAQADIAALKAERAHLGRPERIGPLARELGLAPPSPDQLVRAMRTDPAAGTGSLGRRPVAGERP